jgi:hypothetical protein
MCNIYTCESGCWWGTWLLSFIGYISNRMHSPNIKTNFWQYVHTFSTVWAVTGSHPSVQQDPCINLNIAVVISSGAVDSWRSLSESVWLVTSLHPNCLVCELDAHIPNEHVGREEVLQSVDTVTRHAIEWITHGPLIRVQFITDPTENSSIITCPFRVLVYLWINDKNGESLSGKTAVLKQTFPVTARNFLYII